ncbi:TPA: 50S ribosomal protein L35ae [Candidatus Bathyarchaeota archaeon]|nr:50S ribosomal protein L35ae [Candidatus Bathyarchaeota archaeon]
MEGTILNYRLGSKAQHPKEYIVKFAGVRSRDRAAQLVGRKVVWYTRKGRPLVGKVIGVHGRRGVVRVRFRKGLPGEALGTRVKLKSDHPRLLGN